MRVLHVIPYFSARLGGVAQVVHQLARHLSQRGHHVTVAAGDYFYGEAGLHGNYETVLFPSIVSRWGFYFTPDLFPWAQKHVATYDIVHLHEVRTFQNAVLWFVSGRSGIPFVLSAHGTLPVIVQRKLAKRFYDVLIGRAILSSAARLIAVSDEETRQYRSVGIEERRIQRIPNGLDLDEFAHLPARGTFRREHRLQKDAKVVLFMGRLHRTKGLENLVRAFARLRLQSGSGLILVVAGPDEGELHSLKRLAAELDVLDCVDFPGPLYGRDRLAAFVDADVVATPSAYEIFGLVPFEALMCGSPVLVASKTGAGQLISDADAGYTAPFGDVDGLARALHQSMGNLEQATQKVRRGQAFIRKHLGWDEIIRRLEAVYEECLPVRRRGSPERSPEVGHRVSSERHAD